MFLHVFAYCGKKYSEFLSYFSVVYENCPFYFNAAMIYIYVIFCDTAAYQLL
jgi:hypothetical protein